LGWVRCADIWTKATLDQYVASVLSIPKFATDSHANFGIETPAYRYNAGMRQTLKLHPDALGSGATHIEVDAARPRAGILALSYVVTGTIGELLLPPVAAAARTDELWRHTCFEAFIRPMSDEVYYEFNFSPSTQWAAYRFDRYRSGMQPAREISAPRIEGRSAPGCYTLRVSLQTGELPSSPWRVGLAAVIEETSGRKSYWALAHPPGKADFHHPVCFAYELGP
jgi:hypothetical protein